MYTDLFGKQRMKINLHMHTTNSDGKKSPEEAVAVYKAAGYDAVALTDHWKFHASGEIDGLRILSGAEYNNACSDTAIGLYHVVAVGCKEEPAMTQEAETQEIIDEINRCGGVPILAHPAWSLNTPDQGLALQNVEFTEIYNSVSDAHESSRPYSGYFADACAVHGKQFGLIAADDVHYYDSTDETKSWIMLECDETATDDEILAAIRNRKFYSTQGPEVHAWRENDVVKVCCSPVCRISMFSNAAWSAGACVRGKNLTEHTFKIQARHTFVRVEVTDTEGKCAWSNIIDLR